MAKFGLVGGWPAGASVERSRQVMQEETFIHFRRIAGIVALNDGIVEPGRVCHRHRDNRFERRPGDSFSTRERGLPGS